MDILRFPGITYGALVSVGAHQDWKRIISSTIPRLFPTYPLDEPFSLLGWP